MTVDDVQARLAHLGRLAWERPRLDGHGRLLRKGAWVGLSPIEERLATVLVARFEAVTRTDDLLQAAAPGPASAEALRGDIRRLRVAIAPLDLAVVVVRGVGYALTGAVTRAGGERSPGAGRWSGRR